jgi:hypothetical protein
LLLVASWSVWAVWPERRPGPSARKTLSQGKRRTSAHHRRSAVGCGARSGGQAQALVPRPRAAARPHRADAPAPPLSRPVLPLDPSELRLPLRPSTPTGNRQRPPVAQRLYLRPSLAVAAQQQQKQLELACSSRVNRSNRLTLAVRRLRRLVSFISSRVKVALFIRSRVKQWYTALFLIGLVLLTAYCYNAASIAGLDVF